MNIAARQPFAHMQSGRGNNRSSLIFRGRVHRRGGHTIPNSAFNNFIPSQGNNNA